MFSNRAVESVRAGVGQHGEDDGAVFGLLGDLPGDGEGGAAGDARHDAFLRRELTRPLDGGGPGDGNELVVVVPVDCFLQHEGNEVGRPALHRVRLEGGMAHARRAIL